MATHVQKMKEAPTSTGNRTERTLRVSCTRSAAATTTGAPGGWTSTTAANVSGCPRRTKRRLRKAVMPCHPHPPQAPLAKLRRKQTRKGSPIPVPPQVDALRGHSAMHWATPEDTADVPAPKPMMPPRTVTRGPKRAATSMGNAVSGFRPTMVAQTALSSHRGGCENTWAAREELAPARRAARRQ
jgi:hypothetical protein